MHQSDVNINLKLGDNEIEWVTDFW